MPKYRMQAPDGKTYEIDGPAGATDDQVKATILAQNPHLSAPQPQARPVLSARPAAPKPQAPAAPQQNWFQRAASGVGNAVGGTFRGIQDEIPGIDHVAAMGNEIGQALHLNKSTMSYADRVKYYHDQRQNAMQQDVHGDSNAAAVGHYVGEVAGALGTGMGEGRLASRAVGNIAGKIAPATNVLTKIAPKAVKVATSAPIKITAAGAAAGATNAAADSTSLGDVGTNAAEGAVGGAVMAPVAAVGLKVASVLSRPIVDKLGLSSAAGIVKRYISTTAEDLEARRAAWKARTGADPTLFEVLPLADRQKVQGMLGIVPGETKERAAGLIKERASNIGPEISDQAKAVINPARQKIVDQMATEIHASRGDNVNGSQQTPTPQDTALAERAARDPASLHEVRETINSNIMGPHDEKVVAGGVNDLVPRGFDRQPDGSIKEIETNPDISRVIRSAAGTTNLQDEPVTVSQLTGMVSKLRNTANTSPDFNQAQAAKKAVDHLIDQLPENIQADYARMSESNTHYHRMAEGWKAGQATDLRENVDPTGNFQMVRNQFETPGGAQGRLLGQASTLDQQLNMRPAQALSAADDIATNPTSQEAINRNLTDATPGPQNPATPGPGTQIADSATAQTDSARNLAALNPENPGPAADLPALASNLLRIGSFSPASRAQGVSAVMRSLTKLPQSQATQIVDGLFSQNPAKVSMGLKFLHSAGSLGQDALRTLQQATTVGGFAGSYGTQPGHGATFGDDPAPPPPPGETQVGTIDDNAGGQAPQFGVTDSAAAAPAPQPGQPVDPAQSPYMTQLQKVYDTGDPKLLGLANVLEGKESNHNHFDKDGKPKVSGAGAVGLMQVMPATAQGITSQRGLPYDENALHQDPAYNKLVGVHVLDQLLTKYNGDRVKAAAAYNWRPDALDRTIAEHPNDWQVHLPAETSKYIQGIEP